MPFASSTAFLHAHRPKTPISSIKGGHDEDVEEQAAFEEVSAPTAGNHRRNKKFAATKRTDIAAARDGRLARDRIGLRARRAWPGAHVCSLHLGTFLFLEIIFGKVFRKPLFFCLWTDSGSYDV